MTAVTDRHQLAESLEATLSQLKDGHARAKADGSFHDALLIAGMRRSTDEALRMLTDYYWNESPKSRSLNGSPKKACLSDRQEAMLDAVMAPLKKPERYVLLLCAVHGASLEAIGIALGLSVDEASDVFESMVEKVKTARRQVLGDENAMNIETSEW